MIYYDRIDLSEGIDFTKSNSSKEHLVCHYWYFYHVFKFQKSVSIGSHELLIISPNINNISIIAVKVILYYSIIYDVSKSDAINLLENSVLDDL